jgi:hypothetical protein
LKFYPRETLADGHFSGWSLEERGAWFTLILHNWLEGSLPSDLTALGKLLHLEHGQMRGVWSAIGHKFIPHPDLPGTLTSPRLEMEREQANSLAKKRGTAGKKGATSRWDREKEKHGKRMRLPSESHGKRIDGACDSHTDPAYQDQIQPQAQVEGQPTTDRLAGLDAGLMSVARRLGEHYGRPGPLGVGKDWARVSSSFGRWLSTVGEDFLVLECIRLASEKGVTPSNLSWWPGWLDTATDEQLKRAGSLQ